MMALLRTAGILLFTAGTTSVFAQGTLNGRALDPNGGVLPGALIVASDGTADQRQVTDASGRYEFPKLPAGRYMVTASLVGFESQKREDVIVADGGSTRLDFVLCAASLVHIDWILPDGLEEMVRKADVVALVRIAQTRPVAGSCAQSGFSHDAQIVELLKGTASHATPGFLTFVQEAWVDEPTPYPGGQVMLVLLSVRPDGLLSRTFGPYGVFTIHDDKVTSWHSYSRVDRMTAPEFLATVKQLSHRR